MKNHHLWSCLVFTNLLFHTEVAQAITSYTAVPRQSLTVDCVTMSVKHLRPPDSCISKQNMCESFRKPMIYLCHDKCEQMLISAYTDSASSGRFSLSINYFHSDTDIIATVSLTISQIKSSDYGLYNCGLYTPSDIQFALWFTIKGPTRTLPVPTPSVETLTVEHPPSPYPRLTPTPNPKVNAPYPVQPFPLDPRLPPLSYPGQSSPPLPRLPPLSYPGQYIPPYPELAPLPYLGHPIPRLPPPPPPLFSYQGPPPLYPCPGIHPGLCPGLSSPPLPLFPLAPLVHRKKRDPGPLQANNAHKSGLKDSPVTVLRVSEGKDVTVECPSESIQFVKPPASCLLDADNNACTSYFQPRVVLYRDKALLCVLTEFSSVSSCDRFTAKFTQTATNVSIAQLSKEDEGQYVCFLQAPSGSTTYSTFVITVEEKSGQPLLQLLLLIPVAITAALAALICYKKRKSKNNDKATESYPLSSTNTTHLEVIYENSSAAHTYSSLCASTRDPNQYYTLISARASSEDPPMTL